MDNSAVSSSARERPSLGQECPWHRGDVVRYFITFYPYDESTQVENMYRRGSSIIIVGEERLYSIHNKGENSYYYPISTEDFHSIIETQYMPGI